MTASIVHDHPRHAPSGLRWGASFLAVLALHAAVAAGLLSRQQPVDAAASPLAVAMIDLAPLPAAPQAEPADNAPDPEQDQATPPEPIAEPEPAMVAPVSAPDPTPVPVPVPVPASVLKEPVARPTPPPAKPKPRRQDTRQTADPRPAQAATVSETAAPTQAATAATTTTAPAPAPSAASSASSSRPNWERQVLAHLERHKIYPRAAQLRRLQGVSHVRFAIDRAGNVLSVRLERSSGHGLLDEETLALPTRASPLPAPPADIALSRMELVVPVQFTLR